MKPVSSTPHGHLRGGREEGYVLALVLCLMVIIMMMLTTVLSSSTSNLLQADGYSGMARARATADAGQVATNYAMTELALPQINSTLSVYASSFSNSNKDSASDPIIPSSAYSAVLSSMNAMSVVDPSGTVGSGSNAGTYSVNTTFFNLRPDEASFSKSGQTYYVDYAVSSLGTLGRFKRTVNSAGTLQIRMGRQYLNQFLMLAEDGGSAESNFFGTGMNYDGPVHINKNWMFYGSPIFSMGATTASDKVKMYQCSPKAQVVDVSTQGTDCTKPVWGGRGFQYSLPKVDLPQNTYSQENAALGLAQDIISEQWPHLPAANAAR